jgi:hypothetical protein
MGESLLAIYEAERAGADVLMGDQFQVVGKRPRLPLGFERCAISSCRRTVCFDRNRLCRRFGVAKRQQTPIGQYNQPFGEA